MASLSIGVHASNHDSVAAALDVARAADAAGADTVWISEDLYFHGAVPLAAAMAVQTSTARIGFSVLTPYGHHPARLAMDLATVAELAPRRLILGLGAGVRIRIERMQAVWQRPVPHVRHYADIVQRLLQGETVTTSEPAGPSDDLALSLGRAPGRLPLYVAAMGPQALGQAGRSYDGVLLSLMAAKPHLERACRLVAEGALQADRPAPPVVASVPVRVEDDRRAAVDQAKDLVGHLMVRWSSTPSLRALFTSDGFLSEQQFDAVVDALHRGGRPGTVVAAEVALHHCLAGSLDEVAGQLVELRETGISSVSLDLGEIRAEDEVRRVLGGIIERARTAAAADPTGSGS